MAGDPDGATHEARPDGRAFPALRRAVELWALAGGAALMAVVLMNTWSAVSAALFGEPFPGDFEMTEMGVCIAAFAFLPYCQMTGANVTADIFTSGASRRWLAIFSLAASTVALLFSLLLIWRMWFGMLDQKEYAYTTTILQVPHWWAFVPILLSLALLAAASFATLVEDARGARG